MIIYMGWYTFLCHGPGSSQMNIPKPCSWLSLNKYPVPSIETSTVLIGTDLSSWRKRQLKWILKDGVEISDNEVMVGEKKALQAKRLSRTLFFWSLLVKTLSHPLKPSYIAFSPLSTVALSILWVWYDFSCTFIILIPATFCT